MGTRQSCFVHTENQRLRHWQRQTHRVTERGWETYQCAANMYTHKHIRTHNSHIPMHRHHANRNKLEREVKGGKKALYYIYINIKKTFSLYISLFSLWKLSKILSSESHCSSEHENSKYFINILCMIATSSLFIEQCHSEWSHKKKKSWHGAGHRTVDPTEVGMKEEKMYWKLPRFSTLVT